MTFFSRPALMCHTLCCCACLVGFPRVTRPLLSDCSRRSALVSGLVVFLPVGRGPPGVLCVAEVRALLTPLSGFCN